MDNVLKKYESLKTKADAAQSAADKASGARDQLMKQLKRDFDCSSISDAETKLSRLEKQEKKAEAALVEAIEAYEEKWES